MSRIQVGGEFQDEAIMAVIRRGDFGLGEPIEIVDQQPDALRQILMVGQMS